MHMIIIMTHTCTCEIIQWWHVYINEYEETHVIFDTYCYETSRLLDEPHT